MATVLEFKELWQEINLITTMKGATAEFVTEWRRRVHELGDALCKEQGLERGPEAIARITDQVELGDTSNKLFAEMKAWWEKAQDKKTAA